jgi:hypothetical protein
MKIEADIIAQVHLYPTGSGGRKGATPPDKFGCPLEYEGSMFDCRLLLDEVGSLNPGDTQTVPIVFLNPDLILGRLRPGSRFTLWELRTIGEGIVKEVLNGKSVVAG